MREEHKQIDQRTRKFMTMHRILHPEDNIDWLNVSRKEGGRLIASIVDSVDLSIQQLGLEDYIKRRIRMLTATRKKYRQHKNQENKNN